MKAALILLLLLSFAACRKKDSEKIDSGINIRLWEKLDSNKRTLLLLCSTEKNYPCSNYTIDRSVSQTPGGISINFREVIVPPLCLTSIGPATTEIDLGTLSTGTYSFDVKVDNSKSSGELIAAPDYYALVLSKQNDLQILSSPLRRVPVNTIWGTIGYHTSSSANLAQSFLDSLEMSGATAQVYTAGDYGYFQIDQNGQINPPANHGYYFIKPFIYHYTKNSSILKSLVKNFGINYGDSLSIQLQTSKAETFTSWNQ